MAQSIDTISPRQGITFGLLAVGLGVLVLLSAAGIITEGEIYAPRWLVGVAGSLFILPGLFLIYYGIRNHYAPHLVDDSSTTHRVDRLVETCRAATPTDPTQFRLNTWPLGTFITTGLGVIGTWVVFEPGPREFEGGFTGSETEGRVAFGNPQ